jgi:hypothetical protein
MSPASANRVELPHSIHSPVSRATVVGTAAGDRQIRVSVILHRKSPLDSASHGTTHIVLEALDLMARLAALVPTPRMQLTRYRGVFAPRSQYQAAVTPAHGAEVRHSRRHLSLTGQGRTAMHQSYSRLTVSSETVPRKWSFKMILDSYGRVLIVIGGTGGSSCLRPDVLVDSLIDPNKYRLGRNAVRNHLQDAGT